MKNKRSYKKKFLGVMLSALLVSLPFVTNMPEKVKADDCYTHTNYYLFLNYRWIDTTTAPAVRQTSSVFPSRLPNGAKLDTLHTEWVPLSSDGNGGWSYSKFITYYANWSGQGLLEASNNEWVYFHDKRWEESHTGELTDSATTTDMVAENFVYVSASDHDLAIADAETLSTTKSYVSIGVKRTYGPTWVTFASGHQNKHSFEPAVLKATFQVCPNGGGDDPGDEPQTSGDSWRFKIDFVDQDTGEKLPDLDDGYESTVKNGDTSREFECWNNSYVEGYTRVTQSVTVTKDDNQAICYYKKNGGSDSNTWLYYVVHRIEGTTQVVPGSEKYKSDRINSGETASYTCPEFDGYSHGSNPTTLTLSEPSGQYHYCYYKADDTPSGQTCNISYVDDKNELLSNIAFNGTSLFNPTTKNQACTNYTYDELCPDELTSNGDLYTRTGGKPTIDDNTTDVVCHYNPPEKVNPNTGDNLIFVVWAVGLGAIAYSVYFFRNYYKKQNEA